MKENEQSFDRQENKFFIPASQKDAFILHMENLSDELRLEKKEYQYKVNRTVYFFPNNVNGFVPGFGVRYRDYSPSSFNGTDIHDGLNGSFELKCTDEENPGVKKKLKISAPFSSEIPVFQLINMINKADADDDTKAWFISRLAEQDLTEETMLEPLAAVSYQRERYKKDENIFSIDSDLEFFAVEKEGTIIRFVKTGDYDGLICELKESLDDTHVRWQLYRSLVRHDAERFYSKKGHALNLLNPYYVQKLNPIQVANEFPREEMEIKLDITNPQVATRVLHVLYATMEDPGNITGFYVSPHYPVITSQSTINQYFVNPKHQEIEQKMILRLGGYKYSGKNPTLPSEDIYARTEDKGIVYDYTRADVRHDRGEDFVSVGKVVRIKNAYWIYSPSNRVYKISIDINRKLPHSLNQVFSQLEVEYTGLTALTRRESSLDARAVIVQELITLKEGIEQILTNKGIEYGEGQRKVDVLLRSSSDAQ